MLIKPGKTWISQTDIGAIGPILPNIGPLKGLKEVNYDRLTPFILPLFNVEQGESEWVFTICVLITIWM